METNKVSILAPELWKRPSAIQEVRPGLYQIKLTGVNAFLLDAESDGLVLVDAGVRGSGRRILDAIASIGREKSELRHILVTHCHPDHAGGLAELRKLTSARIYMHRRDAMLVATGRAMRRLLPTPGVLNRMLYQVMIAPKPKTVDPVKADELVGNNDVIPVGGGISVVHTPGHTEGHVVFLAKKKRAAFLGDAAANFFGLRLMPAYEHHQQGVMSLQHLCRFEFDVACFGHGHAIRLDAGKLFRAKWGKGAPKAKGAQKAKRAPKAKHTPAHRGAPPARRTPKPVRRPTSR